MKASRIAVVDDDLDTLDMTSLLLALEGYESVCVASGAAAVVVVHEQQPALVIVDLHMEQLESGLRVVQSLRDDPATEGIPIVVWSADPAVEATVKQFGARGVTALTKPVLPLDLLAMVASYALP